MTERQRSLEVPVNETATDNSDVLTCKLLSRNEYHTTEENLCLMKSLQKQEERMDNMEKLVVRNRKAIKKATAGRKDGIIFVNRHFDAGKYSAFMLDDLNYNDKLNGNGNLQKGVMDSETLNINLHDFQLERGGERSNFSAGFSDSQWEPEKHRSTAGRNKVSNNLYFNAQPQDITGNYTQKLHDFYDFAQSKYGSGYAQLYGDSAYLHAKIAGYERMVKNLNKEHTSQITDLTQLVKTKEKEIDELRLKTIHQSGMRDSEIEAEVSSLKEMIIRCKALLREGDKSDRKKDKVIRKLRKELLCLKEKKIQSIELGLENANNNAMKERKIVNPEDSNASKGYNQAFPYSIEQWNAVITEIQTLKIKLACEQEKAADSIAAAKENIQIKDKLIKSLNIKLKTLVHEKLKHESEMKKMALNSMCEQSCHKGEKCLQDEAMNLFENANETMLQLSKLERENQRLNSYVKNLRRLLETDKDLLAKKDDLIADLESQTLYYAQKINTFDMEKVASINKIDDLTNKLSEKCKEVKKLSKEISVVKENTTEVECQKDMLRDVHKTLKRYRIENRDKKVEIARTVKQRNFAEDSLQTAKGELKRITLLLKDMKVKCSETECQLESFRKQNGNLSKKITEINKRLKATNKSLSVQLQKKNEECLRLKRTYNNMIHRITAAIPESMRDKERDVVTVIEHIFRQMREKLANPGNHVTAGVAEKVAVKDCGTNNKMRSDDTVSLQINKINKPNKFSDQHGDEMGAFMAFEENDLDNDLLFVRVNSASMEKSETDPEDSAFSLENPDNCNLIDGKSSPKSTGAEEMESLEILDVVDDIYEDDFDVSNNGDVCSKNVKLLEDILDDKELIKNESLFVNVGSAYCPTWSEKQKQNNLIGNCKVKGSCRSTLGLPVFVPVSEADTQVIDMEGEDSEDDDEVDFCDVNIDDIIEL